MGWRGGEKRKSQTDNLTRSDKILITPFQMSDSDSRLVSSCQPQAPRPHDLMERNSLNELMAGSEWRSGRSGVCNGEINKDIKILINH